MGQVKKKEILTKLMLYFWKCGATLVWSNEYHIGQVDFAFGQVKPERRLPGRQVVQNP